MKKKPVFCFLICCAAFCLLLSGCNAAAQNPAETPAETPGDSAADAAEAYKEADQEQQAEDAEAADAADAPASEEAEAAEPDEEQQVLEVETERSVEPLDVEEDPFSFEELLLQIEEPESDVRSFIGFEDEGTEAELTLFGEPAVLTMEVSEDQCRSFRLRFSETAVDQLENAISEQLGTNSTEEGDVFIWWYSGQYIALYEMGEGCLVDIGAE